MQYHQPEQYSGIRYFISVKHFNAKSIVKIYIIFYNVLLTIFISTYENFEFFFGITLSTGFRKVERYVEIRVCETIMI